MLTSAEAVNNLDQNIQPLASVFFELAKEKPKAASFLFVRVSGTFHPLENLFLNAMPMYVHKTLSQMLEFSTRLSWENKKGVVVRPLLIDGINSYLRTKTRMEFKDYRIPWQKAFIIQTTENTVSVWRKRGHSIH